jgi:GTPase SAR1 family protein
MPKADMETTSTTGQELEELSIASEGHSLSVTLREVGSPMIPLWKDYYASSDGVLFVVDLSQPDQAAASYVELVTALRHEGLRSTPVCVVLSKLDAPCRMGVEEALDLLCARELAKERASRGLGPLSVVACSAASGDGCDSVVEQMRLWSGAAAPDAS